MKCPYRVTISPAKDRYCGVIYDDMGRSGTVRGTTNGARCTSLVTRMRFLKPALRMRRVPDAERRARFIVNCVPYTAHGWAVRLASFT